MESTETSELRAPDDVWLRARRDIENCDQTSPPTSCPVWRVARLFYRGWRDARDARQRERLAAKMPAMATAHQLRFDPHHAALRHTVETRILSGESIEWIAMAIDVEPRVIALYETLFYDVRRRLHARDFIVHNVIGVGQPVSSDIDATRRAEKLLGYLGGPYVVDELLAPSSWVAKEHAREHVGEVLTDAARTQLRRNLAVEMCKLSFGGGSASRDVIRPFAAAEAKITPTTADDVTRDYEAHMKVFLDQIELSVGRRSIPEENRKYYTGHVEPRADDWPAIIDGGDVSALDEKIEMSRVAREQRAENDDPAMTQDTTAVEKPTEEE